MSRAFGDESLYYKRRREDELKYMVARPGDGIIAPFQCDKCWFLNMFKRRPVTSALADDWNLELIRRANLDMLWSRESKGTIGGIRGHLRYIIGRAVYYGREVPLSPMTPWPLGDNEGMGIAITMLEKSIQPGRLSNEYQQFHSVRKLRSAASDVYGATAEASALRYSLKKLSNVLHLDEGPTQTVFMERMAAGMEARMPKDDARNLPINSEMMLYILDDLEVELHDPTTPPRRKRAIIMTGAYLVITYGYSLRGYEGFWVDAERLCKHIDCGKHDPRQGHIAVPLLGRFKAEGGDRMHVFPIVNVTQSGIAVRLWVERLVALLKEEGKVDCPAFCDEEGYQLYASVIEEIFQPILVKMQSDPNHKNVVARTLDVSKWYLVARSLRRGAESQAINNGIQKPTIDLVNRWRGYERNRGKTPKSFDMMQYYAAAAHVRYEQLTFSAAL